MGRSQHSADPTGCSDSDRSSPQHAQNITRLITHLKDKLGVENTYLMGHSYGSVSSRMDMGQQAHAPWIFVHNLNDQCKSSPYAPIKAMAGTRLITVRGGTPSGDPCGGGHVHSYQGPELEALHAVAR